MADAEEKILKTYSVTIPIAGHVIVEVDAEDKKSAIEEAFKVRISTKDIDQWVMLKSFNERGFCHCPGPWDAEAEEV
jgi:hypothetical protein